MPQVTLAQRYTLSVLLKEKRSKAYIAKAIGKNKTTIYRELKRNKDQRTGEYRPELAQRKTDTRHKQKAKLVRFTPAIKQFAEHLIKTEQYSPEQVCGYMKSEGMDTVSHETFYKHVLSTIALRTG